MCLWFLGWDISSMDLGSAMERAQVFDWSLQEQLRPYMNHMKPRPSIYIPEFIAANQESRADNVLTGTMAEQVMLGLLFSRLMRTEDSFSSILSCHTYFLIWLNGLPGGADQSWHKGLPSVKWCGQSDRSVDRQYWALLWYRTGGQRHCKELAGCNPGESRS